YQHALEVIACDITSHWIRKTGLQDVVLAGGVVANVKMNQRIAELKGVRRLFVHPNMGDGGTGVGAILAFLLERGLAKSKEWDTCYLGREYTEAEIEFALRRTGIEPVRSMNVAKDVAKILVSGRAVARFDGALEYGPRALGNRSILSFAADPKVNVWL